MRKVFTSFLLASLVLVGNVTSVAAYPLNGWHRTGINRLEGYLFSLFTKSGMANFVPGSLLAMSEVGLRLKGRHYDLPSNDAGLSRLLAGALGRDASQYSVSLLDVSDPERPIYAGHNERSSFIPGSVGKIMVAIGLFQALADLYPNDIKARERVLKNTQLKADGIIVKDPHEVPFWSKDVGRITFRPLEQGDGGNLWSYLDYMLSASSNAAASMVMREIVLLKHFGKSYPPNPLEAKRFIANTPKSELAAILSRAISGALTRNGFNIAGLYQGSLFTSAGKEAIPSRGSTATTRELARVMLKIEEGKLVDEFTSLEMKRLLYLTQQRVRYASSSSLDFAAVYYKSGSLYKCRPEAGFSCEKYHGNLLNLMNSVAIVEYPAVNPKYHYIVAVNSNVLRRDSAETHAALAATIQKVVEARHKAE